MSNLWYSCHIILKDSLDLINKLNNEEYTSEDFPYSQSTIGAHLRHSIDHFICFINNYEKKNIDYELRKRDTLFETNKEEAFRVITKLSNWFLDKSNTDNSCLLLDSNIKMKADCGSLNNKYNYVSTSIGRELEFLISHSVHHFAIIAMMCNFFKIILKDNFGTAPSTIRHNLKSTIK